MDELQLDEERPACTECGATCTVETLAVAGHGPQILLDPFEGHR
jgi:hypothetical protein